MDGWSPPDAVGTAALEHLVVRIGAEYYALGLPYVREVTKVLKITSLPHMPRWMLGIANLRGSILGVIDLGTSLGLDACTAGTGEGGEAGDFRRLVVVRRSDLDVAFVVHEVVGVVAVADHDPPVDGLPTAVRKWCTGMIRYSVHSAGEIVAVVLDADLFRDLRRHLEVVA